jgi:hypothetical protein
MLRMLGGERPTHLVNPEFLAGHPAIEGPGYI